MNQHPVPLLAENAQSQPAATNVTADTLGAPPPVSQLTPEEQMALFAKELKEKDWGHQPC